MNNKKNILICPLEWGLGHAGRMVPLARGLHELNHNIFIGSGEEHLSFLRGEVPEATCISFPGFRINYSRYLPQYLIILLKSPLLFYHILLEHHRLKRIIRDYSIDIVISDNRIGLWNRGIKTVYITHQLRIPFPEPFGFLEFIGILISRSIIRKYTMCFVPDLGGELNVSGRLSHGLRLPGNVRYIGILSRLSDNKNVLLQSGKCTVLLSGPEPQRSILKNKLTKVLMSQGKSAVILEGRPGITYKPESSDNIIYYYNLSPGEITALLQESETIITRSGYTTIMELITLGRSAILIPTPGQTEQEYLAKYLSGEGWFVSVNQKDLKISTDLPASPAFLTTGITEESKKLLHAALTELLEE